MMKIKEKNVAVKKYYKVVSDDIKSCTSLWKKDLSPIFIKQYAIGEWTTPEIGTSLFVFSNLGSAKSFVSNNHMCRIFEVEVIEPTIRKGIFFNIWNRSLESSILYLNNIFQRKQQKKQFIDNYYHSLIQPGTIFCKGVKLIKEVK